MTPEEARANIISRIDLELAFPLLYKLVTPEARSLAMAQREFWHQADSPTLTTLLSHYAQHTTETKAMSNVNTVSPVQVEAALKALLTMLQAGEIPLPASVIAEVERVVNALTTHPFLLDLVALGLSSVEQLLVTFLGRFGIPEQWIAEILARAGL